MQNNLLLKIRFIALIILSLTKDITLAASAVGRTVRCINNWHNQYISQGINSLNSFNYKPKQSFLNFFQINQIIIYVTYENPKNIKMIKDYIKENYGIEYSVENVRIMLKKRGLAYILPPVHPGSPPSVEEQQAFINKYYEQKQNDAPDSVRLFGDAMHLQHQNIPGRCWGDPKYLPVMDTNSNRKRLNILGTYNPDTHDIHHLTGEENCNADRVVEFLELIEKSYNYSSNITVYLDNAKYFHAAKVREWLNNHPVINIVHLPAYAPNLNLIERFWKYAKEHLVRNKYYKEYKMFRAKVFQFLNHMDGHIDKLKTLMVDKFQIIYA